MGPVSRGSPGAARLPTRFPRAVCTCILAYSQKWPPLVTWEGLMGFGVPYDCTANFAFFRSYGS